MELENLLTIKLSDKSEIIKDLSMVDLFRNIENLAYIMVSKHNINVYGMLSFIAFTIICYGINESTLEKALVNFAKEIHTNDKKKKTIYIKEIIYNTVDNEMNIKWDAEEDITETYACKLIIDYPYVGGANIQI